MAEQTQHIVCFGFKKQTSWPKFSVSFVYATAENLLADAMRANGMRTCTETGFSVARKRGPSVTRDKTVEQGEWVQGNRTIAPAEKLVCHNWQCGKCNVTRYIQSCVKFWSIKPASPTTKSNTEHYVTTCGLGSRERVMYLHVSLLFVFASCLFETEGTKCETLGSGQPHMIMEYVHERHQQ